MFRALYPYFIEIFTMAKKLDVELQMFRHRHQLQRQLQFHFKKFSEDLDTGLNVEMLPVIQVIFFFFLTL